MQDFRKIQVWQKNREFTVAIYRLTSTFPAEERFGLISQMRKSVTRIGACIAEGCGRRTIKDTLHFFQMGFASATELLHHLITSADLGYITESQLRDMDSKLEEIRKMLATLMKKLRGDD